jgi:hypothetical protein
MRNWVYIQFRIIYPIVCIVFILSLGTLIFSWTKPSKLWFGNITKFTDDTMPWDKSGEYVAMCLAVRDQHNDLPEWLQHHYHHHSIRRFYIMDDDSHPPHHLSKNFGIPNKHITHRYFANRSSSIQFEIYEMCHKDYGTMHRWIALFDADEFLEVKAPATLNTFLKNYEYVGGIGVSWEMYGSSGHLTRPEAGVRKSYTQCLPNLPHLDNKHINTIFNTAHFSGRMTNPHTVLLNGNKTMIDEHGKSIPGNGPFRTPITKDILALHHYVVKSKEDFILKMHRGAGDGISTNWDFWKHVETFSTEKCTSLTTYVP